jgi:1,4-alpha-glucan branching enzyme
MSRTSKSHDQIVRSTLSLTKPVEVTFALEEREAREVFVCGNFNDWSPVSLRMLRRGGNGLWEKRLTLTPGRYEYKYVVDGKWIHDPLARRNVPNAHGSLNSIVEVRI